MTITLHAQPYDISATGFYFTSAKDYRKKAKALKNAYGDPVEEFEIQFIDGDRMDCELAKAIGLSQANFADFLECAEAWEDWQKINVIIATGELGYVFDPQDDPDHYGIDMYHATTMRELAEQFVDEGLFGEVPEQFQFYIDYNAIARDLAVEYSEIEIVGERLIYRAS
ncbi:antirestriction protein ArdA [Shimia aestuarii]|uniref:antirestriction protein ArdA n=1 Tax=Shimia aestuarii TaxID=254406 RepID=UPI001FB44742|nr:antirestriction protein ArdA [Shimia aestuarii]